MRPLQRTTSITQISTPSTPSRLASAPRNYQGAAASRVTTVNDASPVTAVTRTKQRSLDLDRIQALIDGATRETKATVIYRKDFPKKCLPTALNKITIYQVRIVAFQCIWPTLQFPPFAASGIFDNVILRPWASTSLELPSDVRDNLLWILHHLPCFPAYTESTCNAYGRTPGPDANNEGRNAFFNKRPLNLRLWPFEMLCELCGYMHDNAMQWIRLLMLACGLLSEEDISNLASDDLAHQCSHLCGNPACDNAAHIVLE